MSQVTSKDIAKALGVSQATISLVFNGNGNIAEATRIRVLKAAAEMGYKHKPVRRTRKAAPDILAVVLPNLFNPVHVSMLEAIEKQATQRNMSIMLVNLTIPDNISFYYETLNHGGIKGAIFTFTPADTDLVNRLPQRLPVVLLGEKDETIHRDTLGLNSYDAGKLLVHHLYEEGHRHIGFISDPPVDISRATQRRYAGVLSAAQKLGIEEQLVRVFGSVPGEPDHCEEVIRRGRLLAERLIADHPEVTAVIGVDDMTCVGAIMRGQELRPPGGLEVCGFDDTLLARMWNFTNIDHGVYMRVKMALDIIQQRANTADADIPPHKSESQPYLIVRGKG